MRRYILRALHRFACAGCATAKVDGLGVCAPSANRHLRHDLGFSCRPGNCLLKQRGFIRIVTNRLLYRARSWGPPTMKSCRPFHETGSLIVQLVHERGVADLRRSAHADKRDTSQNHTIRHSEQKHSDITACCSRYSTRSKWTGDARGLVLRGAPLWQKVLLMLVTYVRASPCSRPP